MLHYTVAPWKKLYKFIKKYTFLLIKLNINKKITTLRFGTRAKTIKTNFKMNMILSPEKMQKLIDELKS